MSSQTAPTLNDTTHNAPKKVRFSLPDRKPEVERTTSPLPPSSPQPWTSPLRTDNGEYEDDNLTIPYLSDDLFEADEPQTLDDDTVPEPQATINETLTTAFSADLQHLFSLIRSMSIAGQGFLNHWAGMQMPYGLEEFIRDVIVALPHDHIEYPATRHKIAASLNEWIEAHPRPIVQGITLLPKGEPLRINVDEYTSVPVEQVLFDKETFGESEYTIYGRDQQDENCELINGDQSLGDIHIPNIGYNSPQVHRPSRNAEAGPSRAGIVKASDLRQPVVFITEEVERDLECSKQAYEEIDWPSIAMLQVYEVTSTGEPLRLAPEHDETDDDDANRLLGPPPTTFADPGESGVVRDPFTKLRRSRSVELRREVSDDGWCILLDPTRGTEIEEERPQGKEEIDESRKEDAKEGDRPPDEDNDSPQGFSRVRPSTPEAAENEHDDTPQKEVIYPVQRQEEENPSTPPNPGTTEHLPSPEPPSRDGVVPRGRKRGREGDANEGATEEEKRPTRRLRSHLKKT